MKRMKWLGICVAVALIATALLNVAFAADLERTTLDLTVDENKFDSALPIEVGEFYFLQDSSGKLDGGWVKFTAPESGTYSFYLENITKTWKAAMGLTTEYMELLLELKVVSNDEDGIEIGTVELNGGQDYYLQLSDYYRSDGYNGQISDNIQFAVCGPNQHAGLGEPTVVQEPTCTESGYSASICQLCGGEANRTEIPATGHTPGEWETDTPATCTGAGVLAQKCAVCGETLNTQEIPATGHTPGEMAVAMEPTCLQTGLKTAQCTVCGEVLESEIIPMSDHTPGQMTEVAPTTCTEDGYFEQRCTVCNALLASENPPAFGHKSGEWTVTREATCTADGEREQRCAVCGAVLQTETIPAFGHSAGEMQVTREAACLQSGLKEKKCTVCGATLESEEIPALGHEYTEWEVLSEATKEEEGERQRHCIHCGDTQQEKIPKLEKFLGLF